MQRAPRNATKLQLPGPSYLDSRPHWAWHDRLVSERWKPHADGDDGLGPAARQVISTAGDGGEKPLIALGLLTMPSQDGKRNLARQTMNTRFRELLRSRAVVLRYLLAAAARGGDGEEGIADENATHGDMIRLQTVEGPTRCWRKVVEWLRVALELWPRALYVGVADDDVYISLGRLAYDLASLRAQGWRRVYWGQPMWMAYWNHTRFEGEGFGGTMPFRDEVVQTRPSHPSPAHMRHALSLRAKSACSPCHRRRRHACLMIIPASLPGRARHIRQGSSECSQARVAHPTPRARQHVRRLLPLG